MLHLSGRLEPSQQPLFVQHQDSFPQPANFNQAALVPGVALSSYFPGGDLEDASELGYCWDACITAVPQPDTIEAARAMVAHPGNPDPAPVTAKARQEDVVEVEEKVTMLRADAGAKVQERQQRTDEEVYEEPLPSAPWHRRTTRLEGGTRHDPVSLLAGSPERQWRAPPAELPMPLHAARMHVAAPSAAGAPSTTVFLDDVRFPSCTKAALWDRQPRGPPLVVTAADALPLVALYDTPVKALLQRFCMQQQERAKQQLGAGDCSAYCDVEFQARLTTLGALQKRVADRGDRHDEAALLPLAWAGGGGDAALVLIEGLDSEVTTFDSASSGATQASQSCSDDIRIPVKIADESSTANEAFVHREKTDPMAFYSRAFSAPATLKDNCGAMRLLEEAFALKVEFSSLKVPPAEQDGDAKIFGTENSAGNTMTPAELLASMAPGAVGSNKLDLAVRVETKLPSLALSIVPIAPLPLLPTPLVHSLRQQQRREQTIWLQRESDRRAGYSSSSGYVPDDSTNAMTGFITMHETRRAVLLLESDAAAISRHPLVGIWISGIGALKDPTGTGDALLRHPLVWAASARFLFSRHIGKRFSHAEDPESHESASAPLRTFLVACFPGVAMPRSHDADFKPRFYEVSYPISDLEMHYEGISSGTQGTAFRRFDFMADIRVNDIDSNFADSLMGSDLLPAGRSDARALGQLSVVGRLKPAAHADLSVVSAPCNSGLFSQALGASTTQALSSPSLRLQPMLGAGGQKIPHVPVSSASRPMGTPHIHRAVSPFAAPAPSGSQPRPTTREEAPPKIVTAPTEVRIMARSDANFKGNVVVSTNEECGPEQELAAQAQVILKQQAQLDALKRQVAELRAICYGSEVRSIDNSLLDDERHPRVPASAKSDCTEVTSISDGTEVGNTAHNDKQTIGRTLQRLESVDGPPPSYDDVVGLYSHHRNLQSGSEVKATEIRAEAENKDEGVVVAAAEEEEEEEEEEEDEEEDDERVGVDSLHVLAGPTVQAETEATAGEISADAADVTEDKEGGSEERAVKEDFSHALSDSEAKVQMVGDARGRPEEEDRVADVAVTMTSAYSKSPPKDKNVPLPPPQAPDEGTREGSGPLALNAPTILELPTMTLLGDGEYHVGLSNRQLYRTEDVLGGVSSLEDFGERFEVPRIRWHSDAEASEAAPLSLYCTEGRLRGAQRASSAVAAEVEGDGEEVCDITEEGDGGETESVVAIMEKYTKNDK